jgi:hypothetical protein
MNEGLMNNLGSRWKALARRKEKKMIKIECHFSSGRISQLSRKAASAKEAMNRLQAQYPSIIKMYVVGETKRELIKKGTKRTLRAKKNEIIIEHAYTGERLILPRPPGIIWFNTSVNRGAKSDNPVVSPSDFVTLSQTTFIEICRRCTPQQLAALEKVLGDNRKAEKFRRIIQSLRGANETR